MRVTLVRRSLLLVLVLVGALLAVSAAEAADKPYSLTITPATLAAKRGVTFKATFTVPSTAQQALGSANLTPPAGLALLSVQTPGAGTVVNGVAQLRNLAVQPGGSLEVALVADACTLMKNAPWIVAAKQSNDFNGFGNDLTRSSAIPTTTVTAGACATVPCTQTSCTATAQSGQSTLTIDVVGGQAGDVLSLAFGTLGTTPGGVKVPIDCANYDELTGDEATYSYNGGGSKVATYRIDKTAVANVPNNGATSLQLCYGSQNGFTDRNGKDAVNTETFDWNGDGIPEPVFVGLLPDCPTPQNLPCISKRQKNQAGDGLITVQIPAGTPGDPKMRG